MMPDTERTRHQASDLPAQVLQHQTEATQLLITCFKTSCSAAAGTLDSPGQRAAGYIISISAYKYKLHCFYNKAVS